MKKYLYLVVALIAVAIGFFVQSSISKESQEQELNVITSLNSVNLIPVDLISSKETKLNLNKEYTLINFWATWCPPCIKELPLLNEVAQSCEDQIIGFAFDDLTASQEFNDRLNLNFNNLVFGLQGVQLSEQLGNKSGAMPYTILVSRQGDVIKQKIGPFANIDEILGFMTINNASICV